MGAVFAFLAAIVGVYTLLIFVRIILSWFADSVSGKPVEILSRITDPYLDWWRRNINLRIGFLDFSAVVALVFLSVIQSILLTLAAAERITLGNILAIVLSSVWSIVSFIILFFIIIIILRAIAYITSRDIYSPFWNTINTISQPVMYRMNRIIFGNKTGNYMTGMLVTLLLLIVLLVGGKMLMPFLVNLLYNLPI
ncbi:MAG: YggT family protein [Treponema sp.]|nr:YggT family protein [Treponema sp.]